MAQNVSLGYIGFGEAAFHMAKGLCGEGLTGILAYDVALDSDGPYKKTVLDRIAAAGSVTAAASAKELVEKCDFVVICVPARFTPSTADGLLPFARKGQYFIDVTTALPDIKQAEAVKFAEKGAFYVDSAMLGGLVGYGHKVPILASGEGADAWHDAMTPWGMNIKLVGEGSKPGDASRIKLVRSVFTKGLEALLTEALVFAHKCGLEDRFMQSVCATMEKQPFEKLVVALAGSDFVHSERRGFEVGEAMELMEQVGVKPLVSAGAKARMAHTTSFGCAKELNGASPKSLEEIFALMDRKNYN